MNKTRDFSSRNLEQNVRNVIARSSEIKGEGGGVVAGWQKACLSSLTTAAGIGRLRVQISCQGIPTSLNIPPVHRRGDGDQMLLLLMMMMGVGSFSWFLAGRFHSSAARMNIYCSDVSLSLKFISPSYITHGSTAYFLNNLLRSANFNRDVISENTPLDRKSRGGRNYRSIYLPFTRNVSRQGQGTGNCQGVTGEQEPLVGDYLPC